MQTVLLLLQSGDATVGLVAEFTFGDLHTVGCRFVDAFGELGGLATLDTVARQGLLHSHAEHFAGSAELAADHLGLADERVEHAILFPLVVEEVAASHDLGRLQFAVDAAVALFEARGVPRQIDMDEIVAAGLKVQALARRVRADEDADGLPIEGRIEGDLDPVALFEARLSGEDEDAPIQVDAAAAALEQALFQSLDEPASGIVPFRKQNEPSVCAKRARRPASGPRSSPGIALDARVRQIARGAADRQHSIHMGDRGVEIAEFSFCLRVAISMRSLSSSSSALGFGFVRARRPGVS